MIVKKKNELEYNLYVKQPMDQVMVYVEQDAAAYGVTPDELNRAVFSWVLERINGTLPDWLTTELNKLRS